MVGFYSSAQQHRSSFYLSPTMNASAGNNRPLYPTFATDNRNIDAGKFNLPPESYFISPFMLIVELGRRSEGAWHIYPRYNDEEHYEYVS